MLKKYKTYHRRRGRRVHLKQKQMSKVVNSGLKKRPHKTFVHDLHKPASSKTKSFLKSLHTTPRPERVFDDIPIPPPPNGLLDVGQVSISSISKSCNGVLLDPSLVLTSASCVFPSHGQEAYDDISFVLNTESKEVKLVYGYGAWRRTGERQSDFALLVLAQPMTNTQSNQLITLTWSPYALEDIGESFVAKPVPVSCETASGKAKKMDMIRRANGEIITVECNNAGHPATGSPLYRRLDGNPVIYGVYFGQCTSGALDRKMSGLCGSRISKHVFQDFCKFAEKQNIQLTGCDSQLLNELNENFPTSIATEAAYDAVSSLAENAKGAVFIYFDSSLLKSQYDELVEDIESIQRLKVVYDKFQIAVVDVNLLPIDLKYAPYIEYRTAGGQTYLPYNDVYEFKQFKQFMAHFSHIGAPPSASTSFVQHLKLVKRSAVSGANKRKRPHSADISDGVPPPKVQGGETKLCDTNAKIITGRVPTCECNYGYIGNGEPGNCQDRTVIVKGNCLFDIEDEATSSATGQTYDQLDQKTKQSNWCSKQMFVFSYLNGDRESMLVAEQTFTADDCDEEIEEIVACSTDIAILGHRRNLARHHGNTSTSFKRTVTAAKGVAPTNYLGNFIKSMPPSPFSYPANSYFIFQDWVSTAQSQFSTLYSGLRGIPEYTAYKLTHAQLGVLNSGATAKRKVISNSWHFDTDIGSLKNVKQGKNKLYAGRGRKTNPRAVDKGHLNPSQINSFDANTMKLTHTYTNAYPQFTYFNIGVWKKYEKKIFDYAKIKCFAKAGNSEFYLLTGLSDYKVLASGKAGVQQKKTMWPPGNPPGLDPIVQAKSMWTVGCCSWKTGSTQKGEAVSIWANNEPKGIFNRESEPEPSLLGLYIYGKKTFKFFPGNDACNKKPNHITL